MKILHVGKFYAPHKGGMETHLRLLCGAIKDSAHVDVVVSNDDRRTVVDVVDGIVVKRLATWFNAASASFGPGLIREMRRSDADIVHIHYPHPTGILSWLASGSRARLIVTYHSDIVRQRALGSAFRPFLDAALGRAAAIIATSPNYVDSSPVLSRFRDRCVVIPLGVPVEDRSRVSAARTAGEKPMILAVGRLVGYKGFAYLVDAMQSVDARLVIIGDGPLHDDLLARTEALGLASKVTFLREVEDVSPYYEEAQIFVLPSISRAEAFGLVQLEAMAHGKPVINTRVKSGVEFVSIDGQTGITVKPCDSVELAAAINRLLANGELRQAMGAAARQRVQTEFSVSRMAQRTLDLYRRILDGEAASRSSWQVADEQTSHL